MKTKNLDGCQGFRREGAGAKIAVVFMYHLSSSLKTLFTTGEPTSTLSQPPFEHKSRTKPLETKDFEVDEYAEETSKRFDLLKCEMIGILDLGEVGGGRD
ncbi:hypothetical protein L1987_25288 [Smallanthus sonchifolius]|uniref:Uncharacterized protein n=1 Tax=Smallanthus sonchifolius TaxID=185202 RepID=A0ACB9IMK6_9ASTR|nr:hypothetical protein L1987_25288 [Smallanthus sonchifolius]